MGTNEANVSMLEEARRKDFSFTQELFDANKSENPYTPVSEQQIINDLVESQRQIACGEGMNMEDALRQMGKEHGFI